MVLLAVVTGRLELFRIPEEENLEELRREARCF